MGKIRFIALVLSICLLVACAPSSQAIQTAIIQTQAAIPTATPTTITSPTPKTMTSILESYGFTEHNELETGCKCAVYKNAPSPSGMTQITLFNVGTFVISAPIKLDEIIPIIKEIYGEDVTNWIMDNSKPNDPTGGQFNLFYNSGNVGKYDIEIDFDSSANHSIEMIEIK
jgi:hypothetical protein